MIMISIYFFNDSNDNIFNDHRMLKILQIANDSSFKLRLEQFNDGFESIKNNWLCGDFAGQFEKGAGLGNYMHSYISIWRQFGLVPFLLFIISFLTSWWYLYKYVIKPKIFAKEVLHKTEVFLLYGFTIMSFYIVFIHSFRFEYIWLWMSSIPVYYIERKVMMNHAKKY